MTSGVFWQVRTVRQAALLDTLDCESAGDVDTAGVAVYTASEAVTVARAITC